MQCIWAYGWLSTKSIQFLWKNCFSVFLFCWSKETIVVTVEDQMYSLGDNDRGSRGNGFNAKIWMPAQECFMFCKRRIFAKEEFLQKKNCKNKLQLILNMTLRMWLHSFSVDLFMPGVATVTVKWALDHFSDSQMSHDWLWSRQMWYKWIAARAIRLYSLHKDNDGYEPLWWMWLQRHLIVMQSLPLFLSSASLHHLHDWMIAWLNDCMIVLHFTHWRWYKWASYQLML